MIFSQIFLPYVSRSIISDLSELVFDSRIFYTYKSVYSPVGELYQPLWCHSGVIRVISALIWRPQISNRKFVWHTRGVWKLWVFTRQEGSKEEMLSGSDVFLELDSSQGLKKISQPRCSYLFLNTVSHKSPNCMEVHYYSKSPEYPCESNFKKLTVSINQWSLCFYFETAKTMWKSNHVQNLYPKHSFVLVSRK